MRNDTRLSIALAVALVALAGCAPANAPATYPQAGAPQAPAAATPTNSQSGFFKPYPPGQGDTDGLSRDPEDGDRGGIGGNPD